jgi:hypothetical protein
MAREAGPSVATYLLALLAGGTIGWLGFMLVRLAL